MMELIEEIGSYKIFVQQQPMACEVTLMKGSDVIRSGYCGARDVRRQAHKMLRGVGIYTTGWIYANPYDKVERLGDSLRVNGREFFCRINGTEYYFKAKASDLIKPQCRKERTNV